MSDGRLNFSLGIDNTSLRRQAQESTRVIREMTSQIEGEGKRIDSVFSTLAKGAASFGLAFSAQQFIQKVATVRGEFQKLEVAFKTMLQNEEQAVLLMNQLTQTAATTPFSLTEVANGAKQLLAYGKSAEEVNATLIKLGDIAAGLSVPLNDLIYLYGTTMTQGRLYTQDLNQFTGRGIPMIKELAKQFGVAESKVRELVENGRVGFAEVEKAIDSLTGKGSKFGGLMQEQSKTIAGQISNLQDSIEMMFNEIGKSTEGVMNTALNMASKLVENYERVGRIIAELVATYGVYKAALITITTLQKIHASVTAQAALEMQLAAKAGITLSNAEAVAAARTKLLQAAQLGLVRSLRAVSAAITSNPYVLLAAVIAAASYALYKFATRATAAEKAIKNHNERVREMTDRYDELRQKTEDLDAVVRDSTRTELQRIEAYDKLRAIYPDLLEKMTLEKYLLLDSVEANKQLARSIEERQLTEQKQVMTTLEESMRKNSHRIQQIEKKSWSNTSVSEWIELYNLREENKQLKVEYDNAAKIVEEGVKAREKAAAMADKKANVSTATEELKKATEQAKKLNKEIADLRSGKSVTMKEGETVADLIANKEKELKAVKDTIATLTGQTEKEAAKATKDAEKEAKKELKIEADLSKELASLEQDRAQLSIDLMKDGYEKRLAEIEASYDREIETIRQKKTEWENEQQGTLTIGQADYIAEALRQSADKRLKLIDQLNRQQAEADQKAMNEYLAEWGTYQEKRDAIAEQYRKKMAEADSEGLRLSLQKEMEKALSEIDFGEFKKSISWDKIFGNIGTLNTKTLKSLRDQLQQYFDAHRDDTPENLKLIRERLEELDREILNSEKAVPKLKRLIDTFKEGKDVTQKGLLSKEQLDLIGSIAGDMDEVLGVASATMTLSETLGINLPDGIKKAIDGFSGFNSGLRQIASGNVIQGAISAVTGLANVFKGVGGLFTGIFGSSNREWETLNSRYTILSDVWGKIIDRKKEYMAISWGNEISATTEYINDLYKAQQAMAKTVAESRLKYRKTGDHSVGYNMWNGRKQYEGYAWKDIADEISSYLGTAFDGMDDLIRLTTEQYQWIMTAYPEYIAMLDEEFRASLESIHEIDQSMEDVIEKSKEQLTSMTFDTMEDNFLSRLLDMNSEAKDFADDFEQYLIKALMSGLVASKYRDKLRAWYDAFAGANKDGIDTEEYKKLQQQYTEIVESAIEERDKIREMLQKATEETGVEEISDNSLKGAYAKASQESIDLLAGQTGALRVSVEQVREMAASIRDHMSSILQLQKQGWDDVRVIRELSQQVRNLTERVEVNTSAIAGHAADIKTYSKRSADALESTLNVKVKM